MVKVNGYFRKTTLSVVTALLITGCVDENNTDQTTTTTEISAPRMTMDLPITLSSLLSATDSNLTSSPSSKALLQTARILQSSDTVTDPSVCENYFDPNANFMENGYSMTRFLVGLSQQQSCFADFIMGTVVTMGADWVNQGLVSLPIDENDPEAPSHAQIEQSGDTVQVWLFFGTPGEALPTDLSTVQTLYLTWTGTGDDIQGKFYMVNLPQDPNDLDAPEGVRLDFIRTASTAENNIFLKMRATHSAGMNGFRVDVSQTGTGDSASYSAKGLISFSKQPFSNLPDGLALPEFAASAVLDATGLGASIANFNKFSISLIGDNNQDGTIDTSINEFDLGTYQFNINDKTYFTPDLYDETITDTPYIEQVMEWRNKSVSNATYVADHQRIIPSPDSSVSMINCLESSDICDYNGNGALDADAGEWTGWGLGAGYFANTCIDDASQASDCNAFMNGLFSREEFGSVTLNSTTAEPVSDWRSTSLDSVTQLTSVNPDNDTDGLTTFDIPDAPVR